MAARFWVGGSGTWDNSSTTHWSTTTGGASGAAAPTSADAVTFDGNSGASAVITVNANVTAASVVLGVTGGNFTGTLDFATNNNSPTFGSFGFSGSGTRTLNMGSGTWTITAAGSSWNMSTITGLTFNANSSNLTFTAVSGSVTTFLGGGATLTYSTITLAANASGGDFFFNGAATIGTLNVTGSRYVRFQSSTTYTITTLNVTGSGAAPVTLKSSTDSTSATLSIASGTTSIAWAAIRDMTCSGGATFAATNSFDLGRNTGITIAAPSGGGVHYTNDMGGNLG